MRKLKVTMAVATLAIGALISSGVGPAGGADGDRGLDDPAGPPPSTGGDVGTYDQDDSGGGGQDQQILDDLIVDGSICAGLDCVNGESFGFDTIRLKENNLRIKFLDTSTSASFPSNDWQITANDSANGGLNHFSIDDVSGSRTPFRIVAGAPTNSLYVDSQGDLGLGTSTPVVEAHIVDGDTPTTRLEQSGSSGFTPQTWDVAGNETNFFIRDATNGSRLPFRIRPGAPQSALDIAADGDIGLGTASPTADLHITETDSSPFAIADVITMDRTAGGGPFGIEWQDSQNNHNWQMYMANSAAAGQDQIRITRDMTTVMVIKSDGTVEIPGNIVVGSCTGC